MEGQTYRQQTYRGASEAELENRPGGGKSAGALLTKAELEDIPESGRACVRQTWMKQARGALLNGPSLSGANLNRADIDAASECSKPGAGKLGWGKPA